MSDLYLKIHTNVLVSINDPKVIQCLLEDRNVVGVLGALEYDPSFPSFRANHRQYFAGDNKFNEVVPFHDEDIILKIKQTYRLQFMKDVLARILDDSTITLFTSMIFFNQMSIILALQSSKDYLDRLFAIYKTQPGEVELQRAGVRMVHQISLATKGFQQQQRKLTFTKLGDAGLFDLVEFALSDSVQSIRMMGTELLLAVIELDETLLKTYQQDSGAYNTSTLLQTLVDLFFAEKDIGLKSQIMEAMKYLLDSMINSQVCSLEESTMTRRSCHEMETDLLVANFYTSCARQLFDCIAEFDEDPSKIASFSLSEKATYELLCDILGFCLRAHGAKCREFTIEFGIWAGIVKLIKCPHQTVQLAGLRCWKQALHLEDETYYNHFAKSGLAETVVDVLLCLGSRSNLVSSTCLEVLYLLHSGVTSRRSLQDTMIVIVRHLVESRRDELENKLQFTDLGKNIVKRYDAYLEAERSLLPKHSKFRSITSSTSYTKANTSPILAPETRDEVDLYRYVSPEALVPYTDSDEEEDDGETVKEQASQEWAGDLHPTSSLKRTRGLKRIRDSNKASDELEVSDEGSPPPYPRARTQSPPSPPAQSNSSLQESMQESLPGTDSDKQSKVSPVDSEPRSTPITLPSSADPVNIQPETETLASSSPASENSILGH